MPPLASGTASIHRTIAPEPSRPLAAKIAGRELDDGWKAWGRGPSPPDAVPHSRQNVIAEISANIINALNAW